MYILSLFFPLLNSLISGFFGRLIGVTGSHIISCTCMFACMFTCLCIAYEVLLGQNSNKIYNIQLIRSD